MSVRSAVEREERRLQKVLVKVERILAAVRRCLDSCEEERDERSDA